MSLGRSEAAKLHQKPNIKLNAATYIQNTVSFLTQIPVEFRCQRLKVTYVELPQTVKMSGLDPNFINFIVAIYA